MAIVYANASGSWVDTTIWYSEGQPYNQEPQDGDYIYANGFSITFNKNLLLPHSTISNATCSYTGNSGGTFDQADGTTRTITANLEMAAKFHSYNAYNSARNRDWVINGDVTLVASGFTGIVAYDSWSQSGSITLNGNLIGLNQSTSTFCQTQIFSLNGNVTNCRIHSTADYNNDRRCTINGNINNIDIINNSIGSVTNSIITIVGDCVFGQTTSVCNVANTFNYSGILNTQAKLFTTITTFNNNGTINTSAPLATNITTLNLNGTINTSNDTIADYPITTTNIQEGSHITYTQQQPLGWGELNAPADFEFEYNGSGVSTGAYMIVNKNLLSQSYPQPSYVVSGTTYGDSSQFTGTMEQPDESVVLKDYVYASGTKTGTLDTSSLDVPSDLTQQFDDISLRLTVLNSRISQADIIAALEQYQAVKTSDLSDIGIDPQDITDALDDYGATKTSDLADLATTSDLAGMSTLTTSDLNTALNSYGAAKPTDITTKLTNYGVSTLTQQQVNSQVSSALSSYGAAKPSDVSNALSNYGVADYNTVSNAISNANLATAADIEMIAENMATDEFIAAMINGMFVY